MCMRIIAARRATRARTAKSGADVSQDGQSDGIEPLRCPALPCAALSSRAGKRAREDRGTETDAASVRALLLTLLLLDVWLVLAVTLGGL